MTERNEKTGRDATLRMLSAIEDLCGDVAEMQGLRAALTRTALRAYLMRAEIESEEKFCRILF